LPPRYLGHEELFARTYHISGTCEVGLRRAWSWLKEVLGFDRKAPALDLDGSGARASF